ncbi:hypothetical protein Lalb_Chr20g0118461 [Lupinus albus]|uniref:Uncharacterized protein n=1 Tax=Lupinus albus TaxID=3870 RepID=A0A6A4NXH9_LUPAL|nr:hypothetical protein Lalb_Chr20g0118461 [Lupinus albus]
MRVVVTRMVGCVVPPPMTTLPRPLLFEDGKQRENLRGRLRIDESCVCNARSVLARPIIPLLPSGKPFRT